jgi:hypothetical protein
MSLAGTLTETETKEYPDSTAFNNERGELVIAREAKTQSADDIDREGKHWRGETIAVFKEWLYWEKVQEKDHP